MSGVITILMYEGEKVQPYYQGAHNDKKARIMSISSIEDGKFMTFGNNGVLRMWEFK
jgi:hypothetical protein